MARPGDELVNPVTGQRLVFRRTTRDSQGELIEVDSFYRPHGIRPPEHYHPNQEERHELVSGALHVRVGGQDGRLGGGETLVIPPGTSHAMWNEADEEAHAIWQTRPALKTERFFETIWGLARDGKTNARGAPNLLQVAVIVHDYADEFRLTRPPRALQRLLFGLLAPIARRLGYRGSYPQYSRENGP